MVKRTVTYAISIMLVFLILALSIPKDVKAAYTGQETEITILDSVVGRYKLNYTGSTNHYAYWNKDGMSCQKNFIYKDLEGYSNSSTATLSASTGAKDIFKAYLVWETRSPSGVTAPVYFMTPKGGRWTYPTYAINDWREDTVNQSWAYESLYCMATDVTNIVQNAGYGNYSVCNIPRWNGYLETGKRIGGESPGSWQLIVVEEGDDFPVRAVSFKMGAKFKLGEDYSTTAPFNNGLKSKVTGTAGGQIFFGASNSSSNAPMTENVATYNSGGGLIRNVVSNTTITSGLYRNGGLINGRDYEKGCIRMSLSDVSDIGNGAKSVKLDVKNNAWTTFFFLGMSMDIAFPDFQSGQTTTVNSSTSVTVSGNITNVSPYPNTGIHDGKLVVNLDSALTPTSATAVINGRSTVSGSISGNTVIFEGAAMANLMQNESIRYTIQCSTGNSGKTRFDNSDVLSGYLRSDGVNTGYWIDRAWTSSSYGIPKYALTLNKGTGIASVTGAGEYTYGSSIGISAIPIQGYHWKDWTGGYNTQQKEFTFTMPAGNISLTANAEANRYTIVFDPNGGAGHVDNINTQYDMDVTLPDGASSYQKYTLDGQNVTDAVLAGTIALSLEEEPEEDRVETEEEQQEESQEGTEEAQEQTESMEETEPDAEPETLAEETEPERQRKKVYPSVFMGWSLAEGKDSFIPQWKVGDMVRNLTAEDNGTITMYAVWDDCPWIQAQDLYYTLEHAQSGFITEQEILNNAKASDREDGSPIEAGFHEGGTSFSIPDYQPEDFTQFQHDGSVTENLTVVDSVGSVYKKRITVHIVDMAPEKKKPEGTTRFIDERFYNESFENGGLEDNSIWKTNPEYRAVLQRAFNNLKNDTPEDAFQFTHEDILKMKKFVEENGKNNLGEFYDKFMQPNKIK